MNSPDRPTPDPAAPPAAADAPLDGGPHRVRRQRGHARISLNLTAMIDVVFLLLVYFMVATEFKADEEIYRMDLPERQSAQRTADPFDLDEEPLRIRVASVGVAGHSYQIQVEGPYEQPASFQELYEFLSRRRISPQSSIGLFAEDHPIVVVPTATTRWEHAIETMNAAARARYSNITFAKPGASG